MDPKMKRFFLLLVLVLSGCGAQMSQVMRDCDKGQNFSAYSYCLKDTYSRQGRTPNATIVRAFYANLDAIDEQYRSGRMTDAQAKSAAYDSFLNTIQASNDRNRSTVCQKINGILICN